MSKMKFIAGGIACLIAVALAGWQWQRSNEKTTSSNPGKIELCAQHGFDKHNCYRCNPDLVSAFKSKLDWCNEHNLPESQCVQCDPLAKFKASGDWCKEHGAPESQCVKCDPSLATARPQFVDWCKEHEIAESQCTICNPKLRTSMKSDWCQEHNARDSECILCHPELRDKIPKTSSHADWCEHGFDKGNCYRCDASLGAKFKATGDWCGGHDLPESQCVECHADVKAEVERRHKLLANPTLAAPTTTNSRKEAVADEDYPEGDWCEHGFAKGNCYRCDAGLEAKFKEAGDWCGGHGLPESQCLECQADLKAEVEKRLMVSTPRPELLHTPAGLDIYQAATATGENNPSAFCGTHLLRIKLSDPKIASRIDLKIEPAREKRINQTIGANAEISYNRKRLARIAPQFGGRIASIEATIGSTVKKGDVLAVIESPELQSLLLAALATHETARLKLATVEKICARSTPVAENIKTLHRYLQSGDMSAEKAIAEMKNLEIGTAKSALMKTLGSVELSRSVFERQQRLMEEKIGSNQEFFIAKTDYEVAIAEYGALGSTQK